MPNVEDKFEDQKGKLVTMRTRMRATSRSPPHLSRPRKVMYAGKYVFVQSRVEEAKNRTAITYQGFCCSPEQVVLEDGTFILEGKVPIARKFYLNVDERKEEVEKLWKEMKDNS